MSVEVNSIVYEGLQEAIERDDLNEYHHTDTRRWLFKRGYYPAASWIGRNHISYSRGLERGFEEGGT